MNVQYHWRFNLKPEALNIQMLMINDGERYFDATLQATMQPLTTQNMRWLPIRYPLQTLRVVFRIYWQALRLWGKHTPFFSHPDKQRERPAASKGEDK